jgi:hypothetical protein
MLRDSETEYLTTYDMQQILKKQGNRLSKVELNNWLSTLLEAGLVLKAPKRGKPTTISYNRRYTFDLWKLSQKGRETSYLLEVFRGNTPIQTVEKIVEKIVEKNIEVPKLPELHETKLEHQEKIQTLSIHLGLLKALKEKDPLDIILLSEKTGFTPERILKFIKYQGKSDANTLYLLSEIPMDLKDKILQTIGLLTKKNYSVSLSSEGKKILAILSY